MMNKIMLAGAALAMTATALVPTEAMAQNRGRHYGYSQYERGHQGHRYRYNYRAAQKCADGDGGTIVGAIAGGLLGNTVAGRGDRTLGTVLGAGVGALAGRAIDRSDRPSYCRR